MKIHSKICLYTSVLVPREISKTTYLYLETEVVIAKLGSIVFEKRNEKKGDPYSVLRILRCTARTIIILQQKSTTQSSISPRSSHNLTVPSSLADANTLGS